MSTSRTNPLLQATYWLLYAIIFIALAAWTIFGWPALHELIVGRPLRLTPYSPDVTTLGVVAGFVWLFVASVWAFFSDIVTRFLFEGRIDNADHGRLPGWGWMPR